MHSDDLRFACPLNERLLAIIIERSVWQGGDPKSILADFRKRGAKYMDVSIDEEGYSVSFGESNIFPLLTPEEEKQMVFILSLEN